MYFYPSAFRLPPSAFPLPNSWNSWGFPPLNFPPSQLLFLWSMSWRVIAPATTNQPLTTHTGEAGLVRFIPVSPLRNINLQRHFELPDAFHNFLNERDDDIKLIRRHLKNQFVVNGKQHGGF